MNINNKTFLLEAQTQDTSHNWEITSSTPNHINFSWSHLNNGENFKITLSGNLLTLHLPHSDSVHGLQTNPPTTRTIQYATKISNFSEIPQYPTLDEALSQLIKKMVSTAMAIY